MFSGILPADVSPHDCLLYLDFLGGTCIDKIKKTNYTNSNITYSTLKHNGKGAVFNASSSTVSAGSDIIGTGPITAMCWLNLASFGSGSDSTVMDNTKFFLGVSVNKFVFSSDEVTFLSGATDIVISTDYFVAVVRNAAGTGTIYVNGVLSSGADKATGTPTAGSAFTIGGTGGDTLDATVWGVQIYNKVLSLDQINQVYNKFR